MSRAGESESFQSQKIDSLPEYMRASHDLPYAQ